MFGKHSLDLLLLLSDNLASELKAIIESYLPESLNDFKSIIERNVPRFSTGAISNVEDLVFARNHALKSIGTEHQWFDSLTSKF